MGRIEIRVMADHWRTGENG